jgi:tetratricopeptide (TPR) repeat protein
MDTQVTQALEQFRAALRSVRELQQQNQNAAALVELGKARAAVEALGSEELEVVEARGAAFSEEGVIMQRLNDARGALRSFQQAIEVFNTLPLDEKNGRIRVQLATTQINLSVLYARERMFDESLKNLESAYSHLQALPADQSATQRTLMLGVLQNRASVEIETRRMNEAEKSLREVVEVGEGLLKEGQAQWVPQVVDASGRLAGVLRALGRASEGLPFAERAARWAEAAMESGSQVGPRLFVGTQLQLVDINFALDRFAQAETHLFRAVDTTNDVNAMLVGTGFYMALLRYPDERLAKGNLPKDEVEESLTELLQKLRSANLPGELMDILIARRAVTTQARYDIAQQVVARYQGKQIPANSAQAQLLQQLASDVQWRQAKDKPADAAPEVVADTAGDATPGDDSNA